MSLLMLRPSVYLALVGAAIASLCIVWTPRLGHAARERKNVLGTKLRPCCKDPATGFLRDGMCQALAEDPGMHTVCAEVTQAFLEFSKNQGNDLMTPRNGFGGLKPKQRWCLCAARFKEAQKAGVAPLVDLAATDVATLDVVSIEDLQAHALK